ncbi:NUDIX domain-containing protein [Streptomyces sp. NPDC088789]|uniref:NUDIX domain-containing protein n=1 Tax=Streptomyces sp. NPDC088789 TaxID=3365899 RepID=UPI00382AB864
MRRRDRGQEAGTPELTDSRLVYRNAWMRVREDILRRPDGADGLYGVVDKPDFVLIVPVENDGFHLVEQYRYPVSGRFWEFPQGSWPEPPTDEGGAAHPPGAEAPSLPADAEALAQAELREETGLVAQQLTWLGRLHVAHGYSSQGCHVFLAEDMTQRTPQRETTEADMVQRWVSAAELEAMVAAGEFVDGPSLAALTLLRRHREQHI